MILAFPLLSVSALSLLANLTPAPMQAPAMPAAVSPAAGGETTTAAPSFGAGDLEALRPNVGKEVEITGTPTGTGHSKSGNVLYLNFAGAHKAVALVFFVSAKPDAAGAEAGPKKAQTEDDLKPFVGKAVSVKGKLADYKGDLQIVVNSLDQITVAPTP